METVLSEREVLTLNWLIKKCENMAGFTSKPWDEITESLFREAGLKNEEEVQRTIQALQAMILIAAHHYTSELSFGPDGRSKQVPQFKWRVTREGIQWHRSNFNRVLLAVTCEISGRGNHDRGVTKQEVLDRLAGDEDAFDVARDTLKNEGALVKTFGDDLIATNKGRSIAMGSASHEEASQSATNVSIQGRDVQVMMHSPGGTQAIHNEGLSSEQLNSILSFFKEYSEGLRLSEENEREMSKTIEELNDECSEAKPDQTKIRGILSKAVSIARTGADVAAVGHFLIFLLPYVGL